MVLRAGFAEVDITPPVGTHKVGMLRVIVSDRVLDPLYARAAAFESAGERVAFVALYTLSVRWSTVAEIRRRCAQEHGIPGAHIMVAATHNHAGPAVGNCGDVPRDDGYLRTLVDRVVALIGAALGNMQDAELGFGSCFEFNVGHNRRVIMRDGTARTHGTFDDPLALCMEGPIDPEVAVLGARGRDGRLLGALVNFACHPTHHGGETALSAGFPGVLAREMASRECPVTLYLNGASGNIHTADPTRGGANKTKEEAGATLAEDVAGVLEGMEFGGDVAVGCRSETIRLPFRRPTPEEIRGEVPGAQRFIDSAIYERTIPRALDRIRRMGTQPAEVQVITVGDFDFAGIPAEYFVQHALRIKEECHPRHALVVGQANGMIGYVPTREAFRRGGYETTFCDSSRMAPEVGDMLADCAIRLIRRG